MEKILTNTIEQRADGQFKKASKEETVSLVLILIRSVGEIALLVVRFLNISLF